MAVVHRGARNGFVNGLYGKRGAIHDSRAGVDDGLEVVYDIPGTNGGLRTLGLPKASKGVDVMELDTAAIFRGVRTAEKKLRAGGCEVEGKRTRAHSALCDGSVEEGAL